MNSRVAGLAGGIAARIAGGAGVLADGDRLAVSRIEVTEQFVTLFGRTNGVIILVDVHFQASRNVNADAVGTAASERVGRTGHFKKDSSTGRPIELAVLYGADEGDGVVYALIKIRPTAALTIERRFYPCPPILQKA